MHSQFTIAVSMMIALALSLIPMPDWTVWLRPQWVLMVLIYWSMISPYRIGVGMAWLTGIMVDLVNGSLIGEHALAYTFIIYFVNRIHIRLRMYPPMQQGLMILLFVLLYQFILYCIQGFIGELPSSHLYWLSAITSMLLWPWVFVLLRHCQRQFKIA